MNKTTGGWVIFIAALGMMCGLTAIDISRMTDWQQSVTPAAVGSYMLHFSVTVAAFVGGKLIPEVRTGKMTRSSDSSLISLDDINKSNKPQVKQ